MEQTPEILIVEDEAIIAESIQHAMQISGFRIIGHAVSGQQAIDLTVRRMPDAILMDISLNGEMNGMEAADIISALQQTPIIFVTANAEILSDFSFRSLRYYGVVKKPFYTQELVKETQRRLLLPSSDIQNRPPRFLKFHSEDERIMNQTVCAKGRLEPSEKIIVVVDDDQEMREVLGELLRRQGYRVMLTDFAHPVIRTEQGCNADLVIADIFFPEEELRSIYQLKQEVPKIKIIALSVEMLQSSKPDITGNNRPAPDHIIRKPFKREELLHCIQQILRQNDGVSRPESPHSLSVRNA